MISAPVDSGGALAGGVYAHLSADELSAWEAYIVAQSEWNTLLEAEIGVERAKRIITEDAAAAVTALLAAQGAIRTLANAWVASTVAARTP